MPPRIDQIDELTRAIELPLPPLHQTHLRAIVETLCVAWADLLEHRPQALLQQDEAEINALMETRLLALLEEDPVWPLMVRAIARGRETVSFDGTHLEKRPDLSVFLTWTKARFPLVIECKIIDEGNDKTAELYCKKGVLRFLNGEYAWANREAIMIGYVRDNSTIASTLAPMFASSSCGRASYAAEGPMSAMSPPPPDCATSSHARNFRYPLRQPPHDEPGAIALWHLWLPAALANRSKDKKSTTLHTAGIEEVTGKSTG
jgi:hypothetical protein